MSVTANLTTNVETITATIVVEDETIIAQVNTAARGPAGGSVINAATQSDGTAALYLDSIRFEATNGGPTQLGEMAWESNDGSIDAMLESGVIVAMGEDLVIRVRNTTASPITKGTALAYDGTSGASGRIEVKPWVGANISTAKLFLGFAACDMPANSNGYSQWFGKLTEINTSGGGQTWLDEQIIYAVPGASATITNVAPTSGEYAAAAVVINAGSGTSGILFVRPTFEVASSTSATANTLVLRSGTGGASFAGVTLSGVNTNSGSYTQVGGANFNVATTTAANLTATGSGTVTVSGEGGTTISGGTLTFSPSAPIEQRNGNAAQESRIYGTYTGPGNYRRLALKMSSAGVAQIVAEGLGSGSADNRLEFVTGGATRMTVAADGNITTSGSITATGMTVGSGASAATFNINELKFGSAGVVHLMAASGLVLQNSRNVSFTGTGAGMILWGANTGLSRGAAGQVLIGTGATGSFAGSLKLTDLEAVGTIKTGGYLFANLPTSPTTGMRAYITDGAASPVYMDNAAGGGTTVTPVFYDGTNWINA
jgi:hypothetical protein